MAYIVYLIKFTISRIFWLSMIAMTFGIFALFGHVITMSVEPWVGMETSWAIKAMYFAPLTVSLIIWINGTIKGFFRMFEQEEELIPNT